MHVLRADGTYGIVTGWKLVSGIKEMYNLEIRQDHTYTVGIGQWVVHNACFPTEDSQLQHIFRDAPGHFANDTPANRGLITGTLSDPANYVGTDAYGNEIYTQPLPDGRQVWVQIRGDVIQNAGINDVPWRWDPVTHRLVP